MRLFLCTMMLMTSSAAYAQWEPYPEVLQVDAKGTGAWSVQCELKDRKGRTVSKRLHGRIKHIGMFESQGGHCNYDASSEGELWVSIKGIHHPCPFERTEAGACEARFPAGSRGTIEIKRRN